MARERSFANLLWYEWPARIELSYLAGANMLAEMRHWLGQDEFEGEFMISSWHGCRVGGLPYHQSALSFSVARTASAFEDRFGENGCRQWVSVVR